MFSREPEPLVHTLTRTPTHQHTEMGGAETEAERKVYFHALSAGWGLPVFLLSRLWLVVRKVISSSVCLGLPEESTFGSLSFRSSFLQPRVLQTPAGLLFCSWGPYLSPSGLDHSLPIQPAFSFWNTDHTGHYPLILRKASSSLPSHLPGVLNSPCTKLFLWRRTAEQRETE